MENYMSKQGCGVKLLFDDETEFDDLLNSFKFFKEDNFEDESYEEIENIIDALNENKKILKSGRISTVLYDKMYHDFIVVMLQAVGIFEVIKKNYYLLCEQTDLKQTIIDLQQKQIDMLEKELQG